MSDILKTPVTLSSMIFILFFLIMCHMPESHNGNREAQITQSIDTQDLSLQLTAVADTAYYNFNLQYLMGRFDPAQNPDFILIDSIYADRTGLYLHRNTYTAFVAMYEAALLDGIRLQIRSATRNFNAQKYIWERKWTGETTIENGRDASVTYPESGQRATMILKYSSMPGTSRHHWGTDIDLNSFENSWFESGPGLDIYNWLTAHAAEFGFCQPYSARSEIRPYGYEEERWHWSYMPLSRVLTGMAADSLRDEMIAGFLGSEVARELKIVERYVLGVHPACLTR